MFRNLIIALLLGIFLLTSLSKVSAEEEKEKTSKADSVKVSSMWLNDKWKRVEERTDMIRKVQVEASTPSIETGTKAQPVVTEENFVFKEKSQSLNTQDIKQAVDLLKENIAEELYLIGQCYAIMGEEEKALAFYGQLLKEYPMSEYAKKAKEEIKGL